MTATGVKRRKQKRKCLWNGLKENGELTKGFFFSTFEEIIIHFPYILVISKRISIDFTNMISFFD